MKFAVVHTFVYCNRTYVTVLYAPHIMLTLYVSLFPSPSLSLSEGFFVGKEGPMIHSGAIVGAGIPQLRSMFFKWINLPYHYFRSDKEKRDFVSSGAAAGIAGTILLCIHTLL